MQLHNLQTRNTRRRRVIGRGGKRGKTSGRGTKGQKARAGHKMRPELRDIIKKLPKRRGYRFQSFAEKPRVISLAAIAPLFTEKETVTPKALKQKGLIRGTGSVKILGSHALGKKLTVRDCLVSASSRESIEQSGGVIV
ncbi:50S ribosomal protein L15 [Candidatus Kaiserbacteria bacterium RIFCSPHIGHO2_02_FULL_50_9]|uniref:Large ribosomal subunit protein uL15 n=1 Tax=Candidatus Kaiserbacteria bacterium RIFCSPLOWO2_01_FULL_51_21 TaxID=1798508 RepID=A0A1F6ECQ4_9BACT|nr:MAG: 50S ribosomal protein L15 [Candidatus Kaiserbacteria bacterium RIFCSPHIGHO2_01_FULL_51_33]OGG63351.1 MAG: 50S ribosomal protein L15 [Candidatus Kaiserbacteria bacterium RIFCSPHIGHO2_02_FULL_50_9]OGG71380.1 MAG: 50S ribosomal protein L15 [Candidatus Kaiserbacteria bacterium RIFCSPLOWO2_01_FULL_51_21]